MASILNLVDDIKKLLTDKGAAHEFNQEHAAKMAVRVAEHTLDTLTTRAEKVRDPSIAYPSEIGKACIRQIWFKYNPPKGLIIPGITPALELKFLMGDYTEELMLFLAKEAGHSVRSEQELVDYDIGGLRIRGRMDAIIDDVIVDVKSTSPYSFSSWNGQPLTAMNDSFGYRWQVNAYAYPTNFINKDQGALLLLDKQNGHIGLANVDLTPTGLERRVFLIKRALDTNALPARRPEADPQKTDPKNGHLGIECQYCDYNVLCWQDRDITKVIRSGKVVWLISLEPGGVAEPKPTDTVITLPYQGELDV
jgi:hypothetical protein